MHRDLLAPPPLALHACTFKKLANVQRRPVRTVGYPRHIGERPRAPGQCTAGSSLRVLLLGP
ncbi:hypothetical protein [Mycobacterium barrassiae]|uniref:hypothetical protein n=1 Tax=Mycobacterium barrassiae TaxID=319709 RepID=UPI002265A8FC|nr:hypothetical protein [Mycobacterium barrassiae]